MYEQICLVDLTVYSSNLESYVPNSLVVSWMETPLLLKFRLYNCCNPEVQHNVYLKCTDTGEHFWAGNVQPYKFILPPTWKQVRVANILSGNYCQPKCAEPWVEVKFENPKQGTVQVVASPMVRLTNKLNATIEEIGNPEKLIAALGPFVTGNSYDPDEVLETSVQHRDNQTVCTLLFFVLLQ